jgi:hypothetical protein
LRFWRKSLANGLSGVGDAMPVTDFCIPIKEAGATTAATLTALQLFYKPRRIILIAPKDTHEILHEVLRQSSVVNGSVLDENELFMNSFGLTAQDLSRYYVERDGDSRETRQPTTQESVVTEC